MVVEEIEQQSKLSELRHAIKEAHERIIEQTIKNNFPDELLKGITTSKNTVLVGSSGDCLSCVEKQIINALLPRRAIEFIFTDEDGKIYNKLDEIPNNKLFKTKKFIKSIEEGYIYFIECDKFNCRSGNPLNGNPDCPSGGLILMDMKFLKTLIHQYEEEIGVGGIQTEIEF